MIYAKDFRCVRCGDQAVVFFGFADPDASPGVPLCKECNEKTKAEIFLKCLNTEKKND